VDIMDILISNLSLVEMRQHVDASNGRYQIILDSSSSKEPWMRLEVNHPFNLLKLTVNISNQPGIVHSDGTAE
jgi:hypothetical protein